MRATNSVLKVPTHVIRHHYKLTHLRLYTVFGYRYGQVTHIVQVFGVSSLLLVVKVPMEVETEPIRPDQPNPKGKHREVVGILPHLDYWPNSGARGRKIAAMINQQANGVQLQLNGTSE